MWRHQEYLLQGGDPDFSYIIDIYAEDDDGSGNRISGIRSPFAPGYIEKSPTPKILDCNGARDFWVGWRNGMIQVNWQIHGCDVIAFTNTFRLAFC